METLITGFASKKQHVYIAIIVIFAITILLNRNFECTCKAQVSDCRIYMVLPCLIFFILMLWTNSSFQRVFRYTCDGACAFKYRIFCASIFLHIFKAFLVSMLWVAYLFFSEDWSVCCMNHFSEEQAQLPCKAKGKLTPEERLLITELNNKSRRHGYFLLFFIIGAAALRSLLNWRKCCKNKLSCFDRDDSYYKLILEEEGIVRKEVLREKVKEKLTARLIKKIDNKQWERGFSGAEELISSESSFELEEPCTVRFQIPVCYVNEESSSHAKVTFEVSQGSVAGIVSVFLSFIWAISHLCTLESAQSFLQMSEA